VARRVLVVTPVALDGAALERAVHGHAGADAETLVVVPAANVSKLQLLTGEVDEARTAAEAAAAETAEPGAPAVVGDTDPVQAVEDALRTFGGDEIVIVTRPDAEASWLEGGSAAEALRRFDRPVTHLVAEDDAGEPQEPTPEAVRPYAEEHELARGAAERTPASLLGRVAGLVWGVAALVAVILVVLWLALR
jgi:hypothetical protein